MNKSYPHDQTDPPILACGEGEPDHVAAATVLVQYTVPVPLSAAGETRAAHLLTCGLPTHVDDAIAHAEAVSPTPPTITPLSEADRNELEAITGYDLTGWTPPARASAEDRQPNMPANMPTSNEVGAWMQHHTRDLLIVITEAVNDLCQARTRHEQPGCGSEAEWSAAVRKESAGIVVALLGIAHNEGVDLPAEVAEVARVWAKVWAP